LVHHGDAETEDVDPRRPLSDHGRREVERLAAEAATRGARPSAVWHSGKLRARQTAEAFWRTCNALGDLSMSRDLQPDDRPEWMMNRLRSEARDVLIAGHFPHLPRLLRLMLNDAGAAFPPHGVVALVTDDSGTRWREVWRIESEARKETP
jgi:phosphohistidine phosphatase